MNKVFRTPQVVCSDGSNHVTCAMVYMVCLVCLSYKLRIKFLAREMYSKVDQSFSKLYHKRGVKYKNP